jgi:hypothetical protein
MKRFTYCGQVVYPYPQTKPQGNFTRKTPRVKGKKGIRLFVKPA